MKTDLLDIRNCDCIDLIDDSYDVLITDPPYGINFEYSAYRDSRDALVELIVTRITPMIKRAKRSIILPGPTQICLYPEPDWIGCVHWDHTGTWGKYGFNQWTPMLMYGADIPGIGSVNGILKSDTMSFHGGSSAIQEVSRIKQSGIHPCPKPMSIMKRVVARFTEANDRVFDPFMGSGSTPVACNFLNRSCLACEIDEDYYNAACERIKRETAQTELAFF